MAEARQDNLEFEVTLFDEWVLAKRAGRAVDIEGLVARLPEDQRAEFRQLLTTTDALQTLAERFRDRMGQLTRGDGPPPTVEVEKK